jgi:hypothetical protein
VKAQYELHVSCMPIKYYSRTEKYCRKGLLENMEVIQTW